MFCLKHHCQDALVWCMLRMIERIQRNKDNYEHELSFESLEPSEIECLIGCLDRLPKPVPLISYDLDDPKANCWDAVLDALTMSKNIVKIVYVERSSSRQELAQLMSAINNAPTISELDINVDRNNVDCHGKVVMSASSKVEMSGFP